MRLDGFMGWTNFIARRNRTTSSCGTVASSGVEPQPAWPRAELSVGEVRLRGSSDCRPPALAAACRERRRLPGLATASGLACSWAACARNLLRSARPCFLFDILQPALCVQSGHAAGSGAGDGLTIDVILAISGRTHTGHG